MRAMPCSHFNLRVRHHQHDVLGSHSTSEATLQRFSGMLKA